jgi:hypothetical protein
LSTVPVIDEQTIELVRRRMQMAKSRCKIGEIKPGSRRIQLP